MENCLKLCSPGSQNQENYEINPRSTSGQCVLSLPIRPQTLESKRGIEVCRKGCFPADSNSNSVRLTLRCYLCSLTKLTGYERERVLSANFVPVSMTANCTLFWYFKYRSSGHTLFCQQSSSLCYLFSFVNYTLGSQINQHFSFTRFGLRLSFVIRNMLLVCFLYPVFTTSSQKVY